MLYFYPITLGCVLIKGIILNNTKTPNFTFLGVKLGVCFVIY